MALTHRCVVYSYWEVQSVWESFSQTSHNYSCCLFSLCATKLTNLLLTFDLTYMQQQYQAIPWLREKWPDTYCCCMYVHETLFQVYDSFSIYSKSPHTQAMHTEHINTSKSTEKVKQLNSGQSHPQIVQRYKWITYSCIDSLAW